MASFIDIARSLVAEGFWLFPLRKGGKTPAHAGWQSEATRDLFDIGMWIAAGNNLGIFTGKFGDNEALIAIDVDVKDGRRGDLSLVALDFEGCDCPATYRTRTPSGGDHLYYRVPTQYTQGTNVLGSGLDIRSRGGYCVAPGSVVPDGVYTVAEGRPVATAPSWLVAKLDQKKPTSRLKEDVREFTAEELEASTVYWLYKISPPPEVDILDTLDPALREDVKTFLDLQEPGFSGSLNQTLYDVGCGVRDFGVTEEACSALMMEYFNPRCQPPVPKWDMDYRIHNVYKYAQNAHPSRVPSFSRLGSWDNLDGKKFQPRQWLVPDVIPRGLIMLMGPPKIGKGMLMTQLAACAAGDGNQFLNTFPIDPVSVLYITFEEDEQMVVERMRSIGNPPKGLPIVFKFEWPRIGAGGIEQLDDWVRSSPDTKLIVIDPWVMFAPTSIKVYGSAYNADYAAVGPLKNFTKRHPGISLLLIHHTRKAKGKGDEADWQDMSNSTQGLPGAVDATFRISHVNGRGSGRAKIESAGRFPHHAPLDIVINTDGRWVLTTAAPSATIQDRVLDALKEGLTLPKDIEKKIGKDSTSVGRALRQLKEQGLARNVSFGVWEAGMPFNAIDIFAT